MSGKEYLGIGKRVGGKLYVHRNYLDILPEHLRVRVAEAMHFGRLSGGPDSWNVAKISEKLDYGPLSLLTYENFATDPHPILCHSTVVKVSEGTGNVKVNSRAYAGLIIHRKELMVGLESPFRPLWEELTQAEEENGLLGSPHSPHIGRISYWEALLADRGLRIAHHVLVHRHNGKRA